MAGLSFTKVNKDPRAFVVGDRVEVITDVTFDSSYTTGGYALTPSTLGLDSIEFVDFDLLPISGAVEFQYNHSTKKVLAFTNGGAEVSNATDLSTITGRLKVIGRGFPSYAPSK